MIAPRIRHLVATHCMWWCCAGVLLAALQPFLFVHFRHDGWEDEPGFRVRNAEATALFSPDDREDHKKELETTLYAPASAHTDAPDAFVDGLNALLSLVLALLPLGVALVLARLFHPPTRAPLERVPYTSGAPPQTARWRLQPPSTAPPLAT